MNRRSTLRALGAFLLYGTTSTAAERSERVPTVGLLMMTIGPDDPLLTLGVSIPESISYFGWTR